MPRGRYVARFIAHEFDMKTAEGDADQSAGDKRHHQECAEKRHHRDGKQRDPKRRAGPRQLRYQQEDQGVGPDQEEEEAADAAPK